MDIKTGLFIYQINNLNVYCYQMEMESKGKSRNLRRGSWGWNLYDTILNDTIYDDLYLLIGLVI